ncbi:major facilitator superfamily transporter, partial [Colletotrichum abscissum]|uniref:major facilitator superfamily transporter n=1 Tax=Colletotrichum abscissum TaxID=1671311 RepID=UPI0027D705EB
ISRLLHLRESSCRILNPEKQGPPSGGFDEATRSWIEDHEKNNSEWDCGKITHNYMGSAPKFKIRKVIMLSLRSLEISIFIPARVQFFEEFGLTLMQAIVP